MSTMSTTTNPDRPPATSSRSARALNRIGGTWAEGGDAIAFYTRKKVITERWFGAEGPKDGWVLS